MKYIYYKLDIYNPMIIVRGELDAYGNVDECAAFNHKTQSWDYSESAYWWDTCCMQANVYVHEISEQEAFDLIGQKRV